MAIYAILLLKEVVFFSLFLLLGEIRRVLSGKMGISVTKITKNFNINSFPGIDWHREVIKVTVLSQFHVETATLTAIQSTVPPPT